MEMDQTRVAGNSGGDEVLKMEMEKSKEISPPEKLPISVILEQIRIGRGDPTGNVILTLEDDPSTQGIKFDICAIQGGRNERMIEGIMRYDSSPVNFVTFNGRTDDVKGMEGRMMFGRNGEHYRYVNFVRINKYDQLKLNEAVQNLAGDKLRILPVDPEVYEGGESDEEEDKEQDQN